MSIFWKEFVDKGNAFKSLLGALTMGALLVYENRVHPFDMYAVALCGQLIYSFMLGNFWMSSYQTLKKKLPTKLFWRGGLSAFVVASVAGVATLAVQYCLMNPEAIPTAWWAFRLSTFAFLFNEGLCWWQRRSHKA